MASRGSTLCLMVPVGWQSNRASSDTDQVFRHSPTANETANGEKKVKLSGRIVLNRSLCEPYSLFGRIHTYVQEKRMKNVIKRASASF